MWTSAAAGQLLLGENVVGGMNSMAMQQGGMGLILTTLILTAPPMAAMFFNGTLGSFSAYAMMGAHYGGGGQPQRGAASESGYQPSAYQRTRPSGDQVGGRGDVVDAQNLNRASTPSYASTGGPGLVQQESPYAAGQRGQATSAAQPQSYVSPPPGSQGMQQGTPPSSSAQQSAPNYTPPPPPKDPGPGR